MFNRLLWFTALSLGAVGMGDLASAIEPDYPCYLRTRSGQIISLGALCSDSPSSIVPTGALAPATPSRLPASIPSSGTQAGLIKVREGREPQVIVYYKGGKKFRDNGPYFNYEVLTDRSNTFARLRYWTDGETPRTHPDSFKTAQEAVDYFECSVIGKDTTACPGIVTSPPLNS